MKKILLSGFLYFLFGNLCLVSGQSPILSFDGVDDYVDLGTEVGNGVRTIELWFRPSEEINANLDNLTSLVTRYTGIQNVNEFSLAFQPSSLPNAGSLRFNISEMVGEQHSVYTDINLWEQDKWYHVAAVVDSIQGMMIFIDGLKQSDSNEYSFAPATNSSITTIASWGERFDLDRYFAGDVEDVRFLSDVIYDEDFVPPCPDVSVIPTAIGVWNFNEGSGNLAIDSTSNNYGGQIAGAQFDIFLICETNNNAEVNLIELLVFPNPVSNIITVSSDSKLTGNILLFNSLGQQVLNTPIDGSLEQIDVHYLEAGIYFYQLKKDEQILASGKLVKN